MVSHRHPFGVIGNHRTTLKASGREFAIAALTSDTKWLHVFECASRPIIHFFLGPNVWFNVALQYWVPGILVLGAYWIKTTMSRQMDESVPRVFGVDVMSLITGLGLCVLTIMALKTIDTVSACVTP